jgi:hypothetical protein
MIDWNLLLAQLGGTTAIVGAIVWLARSFLLQSFSRDLETYKADLRRQVDTSLENIRIHDRERTEAFKRLYAFAKNIRNETFPLAEDREAAFNRAMDTLYWSKLQMDQIYFPDRAERILDTYAEMHVCMRRQELSDVTANETDVFLEREAFELAGELAQIARLATEPVRRATHQEDGPNGA